MEKHYLTKEEEEAQIAFANKVYNEKQRYRSQVLGHQFSILKMSRGKYMPSYNKEGLAYLTEYTKCSSQPTREYLSLDQIDGYHTAQNEHTDELVRSGANILTLSQGHLVPPMYIDERGWYFTYSY